MGFDKWTTYRNFAWDFETGIQKRISTGKQHFGIHSGTNP